MRLDTLAWLVATTTPLVFAGLPVNHHAKAARIHKQHLLHQPHNSALNSKHNTKNILAQQHNQTHAQVLNSQKQISKGRFGHGAFYMAASNTILFVGGQLEGEGMYITNDVAVLNLSAPLHANANPISLKTDSLELPPSAWTASAVGSAQDIWLIGGVTADCKKAAPAMVRNGVGNLWHPVESLRKIPPRRRQAQAVSIMNRKTWTADLYVWAGMADEYSCATEPVGYMAIDVWHTSDNSVETFRWDAAHTEVAPEFEPPVTDYAAVAMPDGHCIAFIGGQTANGKLADMRHILTFNTTSKVFKTRKSIVTDDTPGPLTRRGHTAVLADSNTAVVFGGYDRKNAAVEVSWSLNMTDSHEWTWSRVTLAKGSESQPQLAFHSMTAVSNTSLVVGYGVHAVSGAISNAIWSLSRLNADSNDWTWTEMRIPNNQQDSHPHHPTPVSQIVIPTTSAKPTDSIVPPSTISVSTSTAIAIPSSQKKSPIMSAATTKVVVSTIGGIFASVMVAGLLIFVLKKRASRISIAERQLSSSTSSQMAPVSQLLFTRPLPQRTMSLGSPLSTASSVSQSPPTAAVALPALKNPYDLPASPDSTTSVTSYPFLTAIPMMSAGSRTESIVSDRSSMYADSEAPLNAEQPPPNGEATDSPGWLTFFRNNLSPKLGYAEEGKPQRSNTTATKSSSRVRSKPRRAQSTSIRGSGASTSLSPRTKATPRFGHARQETDAAVRLVDLPE